MCGSVGAQIPHLFTPSKASSMPWMDACMCSMPLTLCTLRTLPLSKQELTISLPCLSSHQFACSQEAASIDIPNIPWDVFEAMMKYIYTGNVEVSPEIATDLLQASDQYLLEGLKRLCEMCIAQSLSVENLPPTFELSEAFSAPQVRHSAAVVVWRYHAAMSAVCVTCCTRLVCIC